MPNPNAILVPVCSRCLMEAIASQLLGVLKTANLLHETLAEQSADSSAVHAIGLACENLHAAYQTLAAEAGLPPAEDGENDELLN